MQTDIWGNHEWKSMAYKAFASPEVFTIEDKERYKTFYIVNTTVLPCKMCRESFSMIMKYIPIDDFLEGRYSLCYWLFIVHNLVNRKLEKALYEFKNFVFDFEQYRARCGSKNDVVKYNECKKNQKEYTREEAKEIAIHIGNKYKLIAEIYLDKYYKSNDFLDPKVHK